MLPLPGEFEYRIPDQGGWIQSPQVLCPEKENVLGKACRRAISCAATGLQLALLPSRSEFRVAILGVSHGTPRDESSTGCYPPVALC